MTQTFINENREKLEIGGLWFNNRTGETHVERLDNDGVLTIPLGRLTEDEWAHVISKEGVDGWKQMRSTKIILSETK